MVELRKKLVRIFMSPQERKILADVRKQLAEEKMYLADLQRALNEEFIPSLEKAKQQLVEEREKLESVSDSNEKSAQRACVSRIEKYVVELEEKIKELQKAAKRIRRLLKKVKDNIE